MCFVSFFYFHMFQVIILLEIGNRVERIDEAIKESIRKNIVQTNLQLSKLALVFSRITALTGVLVRMASLLIST